jgi:hypothetical protein
MVTRFEDWPTRLAAHFERARSSAFVWSQTDCAMQVAAGILAMTGVDFSTPFRGRYHDETSATAVMIEVTGGGLAAVATRALGEPLLSHRLAQRGDVVLLDVDTPAGMRSALGLVDFDGMHVLVAAWNGGLVAYPVSRAHAAWRVG